MKEAPRKVIEDVLKEVKSAKEEESLKENKIDILTTKSSIHL